MNSERPSPAERYARDLAGSGFSHDPEQAAAVAALQEVYEQLIKRPPRRRLGSRRRTWPPVQGLYIWGGVGRGKTYLMDQFYESLPFSPKMRTHFHRFMLEVHERRRNYPDTRDPIARIAADLAHKVRVLCFDEFFVSDIADAMILGRLTEQLFKRGVTLIATSNIPPQDLYKGGLQRERFVPAIDRVLQHTRVLHLDSPSDYRLRALSKAEIYHSPDDAEAHASLDQAFGEIAPEPGERDARLLIHGREIHAKRLADGVGWFDFSALCDGARAAADYIEIARTHHSVLVSGTPQMDKHQDDAARRFITMVDEFYDRGVKLIITAAVPLAELYVGKRLAFEFQRTESRLTEMQSQEYLARPHLP